LREAVGVAVGLVARPARLEVSAPRRRGSAGGALRLDGIVLDKLVGRLGDSIGERVVGRVGRDEGENPAGLADVVGVLGGEVVAEGDAGLEGAVLGGEFGVSLLLRGS
jgi:hypothetical protein